jgi:hypothetical protein
MAEKPRPSRLSISTSRVECRVAGYAPVEWPIGLTPISGRRGVGYAAIRVVFGFVVLPGLFTQIRILRIS